MSTVYEEIEKLEMRLNETDNPYLAGYALAMLKEFSKDKRYSYGYIHEKLGKITRTMDAEIEDKQ